MAKVNLKNTFVTDIEFKNKPQSESLILQQKFSYSVKYTSTNICRSELTSVIHSQDNEGFSLLFTMVGIFDFDPSLKREEIHKQSYLALYPFAKAFCAGLTNSCGMMPLYITEIDVDSREIFRIDLGGLKS